jgi:hypothetical protein
MSGSNGSEKHGQFPESDTFVDFAGATRKFTLRRQELPWGHGVLAIEDAEGDDGYEFHAFSPVDPFHALGILRQKIARILSVRHLVRQDGRLSLTHDRMRGRISYGGVVVDGTFLTFDQMAELVQTYEGFQFDLKIVDPSDALE